MTQAAVLASNASLMTTPSGTAPSFLCRAWVNFDGTGTVAIRGSGNVSSITDGGTGIYTVNLTNAMSDVNYAVNVAGRASSGIPAFRVETPALTTAFNVISWDNLTLTDAVFFSVAVFR